MKFLLQKMICVYSAVIFPERENGALISRTQSQEILKLVEPEYTHGVLTALPHRHNIVHTLLYAIKYEKHVPSIKIGASILRNLIDEEYLLRNEFEKMNYVLCTIPMTIVRYRREQYDHLDLLVRHIYKNFRFKRNIVYRRNLLSCQRNIQRQSNLRHIKERKENMQDAFKVTKAIPKNTICFIIDDTCTTGTTMQEAARKLRECGATAVIPITLVRA